MPARDPKLPRKKRSIRDRYRHFVFSLEECDRLHEVVRQIDLHAIEAEKQSQSADGAGKDAERSHSAKDSQVGAQKGAHAASNASHSDRHARQIEQDRSLNVCMKKSASALQLFLDQELREQVMEKYEHIQKLRSSEFEYIKSEAATRDNIKRYMDKILEMPNVDLDYELRIAMQKLSILRIS